MSVLKRMAARLPHRWQTELKRLHFARQIRNGTFFTDEAEYRLLPEFVGSGDWVIDIGANVGQYTRRLSELVGPGGRVLAFEPVITTFSLLAANVERFPLSNVTLLNAGASDATDVVGMSMPTLETGLVNYYEAHITAAGDAAVSAMTFPVDALALPRPVSLVKIDAEGHEAHVIAGMRGLITTHHPTLIVETGSETLIEEVRTMGYGSERLPGSSNVLFRAANA